MKRSLLVLTLVIAACDNKLNIAVNGGPSGADVGRMAASEIRQARAAKGKRVDVRIVAMKSVVLGHATPDSIRASLDSLPDDDHVAVAISRFLDEQIIPVAQKFKSAGLPFLSTTPLTPGIASANGPGFSLVPGYAKQAAFLAAQSKPGDRVAIVYLNNYYGKTLTSALLAELAKRHLTPVATPSYEQSWDEPRMVALGTELQKTKEPTLVYFIGRAPSLELVWQPFRDVGKTIRVVGSDLVESTAVYENPEGRFTGLRYVRYFDPQNPDARMKDLHERYAIWIGRGEMTGEAVIIYDAMMLTADAFRSGARTRAELAQYYASLGRARPPFKGVGGLISFGADGEVDRKFELAEVTNRGVIKATD